jgi:hypothetical protein
MSCDPEPLRFVRSPQSNSDFTVDWSGALGGVDPIVSSTWTPLEEDGLTVTDSALTDSTTTVWVSGGTAGSEIVGGIYTFGQLATYYHLRNAITTAAGRTDERTITFVTKEL